MLMWQGLLSGQPPNEIFRLGVNGTTVYDVYGHTITSNMGVVSGALVGDGTAKSAIISNPADFTFGTNDFEIEAEVYRTGNAPTTLGCLVSRSTVNIAGGFAFLLLNNVPTVYLTDATQTSNWKFVMGGGTCPLNTWTRLRVARVGSLVSLYVDDVLVNSQPYTLAVGTSNISTAIGGNADRSHPMVGHIKNVVIRHMKK
ncbi:hypothetical protein D3C75_658740 [compost metagenome]